MLYVDRTNSSLKKTCEILNRLVYSDPRVFDHNIIGNALSFCGITLLGIGIIQINRQVPYPGYWGLLPVMGAACLILSGDQAWVNKTILSNRLLVAVGLISYPLYLWHWPILSFLRITESEPVSLKLRVGGVFFAFILACATYCWIERPIRHGGYQKQKTIILIALMAIICFVGYNTYAREGLKFRGASNHGHMLEQLLIPIDARQSDGSCEKTLLLNESKDVTCLANSENPKILIIGDSHAMALNFSAYFKLVDARTILIASSGCLPFSEAMLASKSATKSCYELVSQYWQVLEKVPSIEVVVLASMAPDELVDKNGKDSKLFLPINKRNLNSREIYETKFSNRIQEAEKFQKKVLFLIDVPLLLASEPETCIATRPISIAQKLLKNCTSVKQDQLTKQSQYREIISRIQKSNPKLMVYDSFQDLCDQEKCYGYKDGVVFYYDRDHLSIDGSKLVLSKLINQIN